MDAAEPPHIVFESRENCADGRRVRQLLELALAAARAPGPGWSVAMRVDAAGPGVLRAAGEISDGHGAPVGHRLFERKASDCSGLAQAIGVWASLVLDAEVHRPRNVARAEESSPETDAADNADAGAQAGAKLELASATTDATLAPPWPAPNPEEKASPDREWSARRDEGRAIEIGAGGFLMSGAGGGLMGGVSPFVVIEVAKGVFVRPAIVVGQALPSSGPDITLIASRTDGCLRVAGLYTSRNGMQLDMCGGFDVGVVEVSRTLPYLGVGPSLDLRGELGGDLAATLRGLFDVNLVEVRGGSVDTPLWAGRVELAMSWRLR